MLVTATSVAYLTKDARRQKLEFWTIYIRYVSIEL